MTDFHNAVDDYLAVCEERGERPETAYKGSLNVRFKKADIHRRAAIYAMKNGQSLNSFIEEAVEEKLILMHACVEGVKAKSKKEGSKLRQLV